MIKTELKTNNCGELNLKNIDEEVTLSGGHLALEI